MQAGARGHSLDFSESDQANRSAPAHGPGRFFAFGLLSLRFFYLYLYLFYYYLYLLHLMPSGSQASLGLRVRLSPPARLSPAG